MNTLEYYPLYSDKPFYRHFITNRYRQITYAYLLILILVLLNGCSSHKIHTQTVDSFEVAGQIYQMEHTTLGKWQANIPTVTQELPRIIKQFHWGVLKISYAKPATPNIPFDFQPINATALLPDDRQATIVIWQSGYNMNLAIRVGYFGDALLEAKFISHCAQMLRATQKKTRINKFQLPDD